MRGGGSHFQQAIGPASVQAQPRMAIDSLRAALSLSVHGVLQPGLSEVPVKVSAVTEEPTPQQWRDIINGAAAIATTAAEMGKTDQAVAADVLGLIEGVRVAPTADLLRAVSAAISSQPQPLDQSAEERERMRPIEQLLGVTSPEQQLSAALRAKAIVDDLAQRLDAADGSR